MYLYCLLCQKWRNTGVQSIEDAKKFIAKWILGNKIQWTSNENIIEQNAFENMSSAKWRPFCSDQNVLTNTDSLTRIRLILGLRPANQRRRHKVTPSLIGWAQT